MSINLRSPGRHHSFFTAVLRVSRRARQRWMPAWTNTALQQTAEVLSVWGRYTSAVEPQIFWMSKECAFCVKVKERPIGEDTGKGDSTRTFADTSALEVTYTESENQKNVEEPCPHPPLRCMGILV